MKNRGAGDERRLQSCDLRNLAMLNIEQQPSRTLPTIKSVSRGFGCSFWCGGIRPVLRWDSPAMSQYGHSNHRTQL